VAFVFADAHRTMTGRRGRDALGPIAV
jgi:hypothetical protein